VLASVVLLLSSFVFCGCFGVFLICLCFGFCSLCLRSSSRSPSGPCVWPVARSMYWLSAFRQCRLSSSLLVFSWSRVVFFVYFSLVALSSCLVRRVLVFLLSSRVLVFPPTLSVCGAFSVLSLSAVSLFGLRAWLFSSGPSLLVSRLVLFSCVPACSVVGLCLCLCLLLLCRPSSEEKRNPCAAHFVSNVPPSPVRTFLFAFLKMGIPWGTPCSLF